ncbi:CRAL-TRIO domain-containing protein [Cladochytrium replicatum]|nr:CRAL-TRIO domain-containing protein [Cladochytrium replicatum]
MASTGSFPAHLAALTAEERALLREMWQRTLEEIEALDAEAAASGVNPQSAFIALNGSHQAPSIEPGHTFPVTDPHYVTEGVRVASTYLDYFWVTLGIEHPDTLISRFLRARKWDVEKAVEMIKHSIKWRKDYGTLEIIREGEACLDKEEIVSGKVYFNDVDQLGRPVASIHVRMHNKYKVSLELTKRLTVILLETGRQLIRPPVIAATLIFDMTHFGLVNMDYNFINFLVSTLEAHYPESLGAALILNAPWIFNGCWTIIRPWLDPVVASKVHFIQSKDLDQHIKKENINKALDEKNFTSDYVFTYAEPTADDIAWEKKIKGDKDAQDKAREEYKAAWTEFNAVNREWYSVTDESAAGDVETRRETAARKLREKLAVLDIYLRGRTTYHRSKYLPEATQILKEIQ